MDVAERGFQVKGQCVQMLREETMEPLGAGLEDPSLVAFCRFQEEKTRHLMNVG